MARVYLLSQPDGGDEAAFERTKVILPELAAAEFASAALVYSDEMGKAHADFIKEIREMRPYDESLACLKELGRIQ